MQNIRILLTFDNSVSPGSRKKVEKNSPFSLISIHCGEPSEKTFWKKYSKSRSVHHSCGRNRRQVLLLGFQQDCKFYQAIFGVSSASKHRQKKMGNPNILGDGPHLKEIVITPEVTGEVHFPSKRHLPTS